MEPFKLGSESFIEQLLIIVALVIPKILGSLSTFSINNFRSCALFTGLKVFVHKKSYIIINIVYVIFLSISVIHVIYFGFAIWGLALGL